MVFVFPLFLQHMPAHMSLHLLSVKSMLSNYCHAPLCRSTYLSLSVYLLFLYMILDLKCLTLLISIPSHKCIQSCAWAYISSCLSTFVCLYSIQKTSVFIYFCSSLCLNLCVSLPCACSLPVPQVSSPTVSHPVVIYLLEDILVPFRFCVEYLFVNKYDLYMFLVIFMWTYIFTPVR